MNSILRHTALLLVAAALAACGGNQPTKDPPEVDAVGDVSGTGDVPVVFPDLPEPADVGPDAPAPDSVTPDLVPEVVWQPEPCQTHADCEDGFCVEIVAGSGEFFCAPTCLEECPGDWLCKAIHLDGPDLVSICLPGDGCHEVANGTPCNGPDPCKTYACEDGFCVGELVTLDLSVDGVDNDCDGKVDEDAYLGFTLLGGSFAGGPGVVQGGGWTLQGTVAATGFAATAVGEGVTLTPGAALMGAGGEE